VFSSALCLGCGGPSPELTKPVEAVTWPALEAIQSPDVSMGIHRAAETGDVAGFKSAGGNPQLKELVDKFEAEPIPQKFASPAREEAKKAMVDAYRAVIEKAAGSPSPSEMKSLKEALSDASVKLTDPNLK
jgi:hypothetical protein